MIIPSAATASGYTKVISGSSCGRVRTKSDCEEAARQLGLSDTSATEEDVENWPPYCYFYNGNSLYFNKRSNGARDCDSQHAVCICKGKKFG